MYKVRNTRMILGEYDAEKKDKILNNGAHGNSFDYILQPKL